MLLSCRTKGLLAVTSWVLLGGGVWADTDVSLSHDRGSRSASADSPVVSSAGWSSPAGLPRTGKTGPHPATPSGTDTQRDAPGTAETQRDMAAGWRFVQQGEFDRAHQAFSSAARRSPNDPRVLLGLGTSFSLLGQSEEAAKVLERAINLDMSLVQAQGLLGDLYAERGEWERAAHHYRLAWKRDPANSAWRSRLLNAQQRQASESVWDRLYSAHFLVKYQASVTDPELAHELVARLEATYVQVGRAFSYFPTTPFPVVVYPEQEFWQATESPGWAQGLYDGTIHLPAQTLESDSHLPESLVRHEYTHALVDRMSGGRAPVWLTEGLARHFEAQGGVTEEDPGDVQSGEAVSLHMLQGEFLDLSPAAAKEAYAQSVRATTKLIRTYGLQRLGVLLEALSKTSDFSKAFEDSFHFPYEQFEAGNMPSRRRSF